MVERIRDASVAEAIAAEAGTEATPPLALGEIVTPVIQLQPRPPLASSGYFPGTVLVNGAAVALNTTHIGIFNSGAVGQGITRVNFVIVQNHTAGTLEYSLRRVDTPFTGFPSTRLTPGYINAGNPATGRVFSVVKNDTVGPVGVALGTFQLVTLEKITIPGPWILNSGILVVTCGTVNTEVRAIFGYESWPAIRDQPAGG